VNSNGSVFEHATKHKVAGWQQGGGQTGGGRHAGSNIRPKDWVPPKPGALGGGEKAAKEGGHQRQHPTRKWASAERARHLARHGKRSSARPAATT